MAKKVGDLIKQARTDAGLTQEQLAKKVDNVTASDISKAERGEKELTQAALKQIAKATGVTQKSLLDAAAGTSGKAKSGKTTSAKTSTAKKTTGTSMKVTAGEKKILELYREADSDTRKAVEALLKGKKEEDPSDIVQSLLGIISTLGK